MTQSRRPGREAAMARARILLNRLDGVGCGTAWVAEHFAMHETSVARWAGGIRPPSKAKLEALEKLASRLCGQETADEKEETEMGNIRAAIVHRSICGSDRVANLGAKGALIYTWLLCQVDVQGRIAGDARRLKALVVPLMDDIAIEDVEGALAGMEDEGLIIRYADPETGRHLIQMVDWWEHNAGLRIIKASKHPAPKDWVDRPETQRDDAGRFRREH